MNYQWFDDYVVQIKKNDMTAAKNILLNNIPENTLLSTLTKSDEWKHKREWRILKQAKEHKGEKGIVLEKFVEPKELFIVMQTCIIL